MNTKWQIEIRNAEEATGDGGSVTHVRLTHGTSGIILLANVVECEGEQAMVDTFLRDDLCLPSAVARRLVGKVFAQYAGLYRRDREFDGPGVTVKESLANIIDDRYPTDQAAMVKQLLRAALVAAGR